MNSTIISQVVSFVVYLLLQVLFIRNWALGDVAFCFVYVSFMLLMPREINPLVLMSIGFFFGLTVDFFYETIGIHAAACVLLAYSHRFVLDAMKPSGGYEAGMEPTLRSMGLRWFSTYSFFMLLIHHSALFLLEAGGFHLFYLTVIKILCSTVFTLVTILLFQSLFYSRKTSSSL